MNKSLRFFCGLCVMALCLGDAVAATNAPRSTVNTENRTTTSGLRAKQSAMPIARGNAVRTTRTVADRTPTDTPKSANRSAVVSLSRGGNAISDAGNAIVRRAFGISRALTNQITGANIGKKNSSRAAVLPKSPSRARATAVFSDMSKLGDGYNNCRTTYNTCMDQFCAGANETYRRCFCSSSYRVLRNREDALDQAVTMLAQFEDNNLNAVDKTAAEVQAMYSATAGEMAIKKDTSAASKLLDDISDLLSGKSVSSQANQNSVSSLSGLTIDFSSDIGDIWSEDGSMSLFDDTAIDLSTLEGSDLYTNAHNQCMKLVAESCDSATVRNMAKSAYNILITQDCNAYQKKIDAKTEQVKTTVRTAEKYLRDARLEEYRAHNSADVNECMDKVESAILAPTACGPNYVKCLDYSGAYINSTTGDLIYSKDLFKLNTQITLDGSDSVLSRNSNFNRFLDSKRIYAQSALDSCRDIADTVWDEFKRNALIKIAQAQDEKLEEVKMSCVSTIKECYDTQSGALKGFDDTTAQAAGALAARAAAGMCVDKVAACASLYSNGNTTCAFDNAGRITNGASCGLTTLLQFIDTVDDARIAEGCGVAVENYLKSLCTPSNGTDAYPWNCRLRAFGDITRLMNLNGTDDENDGWRYVRNDNSNIVQMVMNYAYENCGIAGNDGSYKLDDVRAKTIVAQQVEKLYEEMSVMMAEKCEDLNGIWVDAGADTNSAINTGNNLIKFYSDYFGGRMVDGWGYCKENTTRTQCLAYNTGDNETPVAQYDANTDTCVFSDTWYEQHCRFLGDGYFENGVCYVAQ